jgi:hypothetical protein
VSQGQTIPHSGDLLLDNDENKVIIASAAEPWIKGPNKDLEAQRFR